MSKHSRALRNHIGTISDPTVRALLGDVAGHMEKLERERRIARKALKEIKDQEPEAGGMQSWRWAELTLAAMRAARRKP